MTLLQCSKSIRKRGEFSKMFEKPSKNEILSEDSGWRRREFQGVGAESENAPNPRCFYTALPSLTLRVRERDRDAEREASSRSETKKELFS